MTSWQLVPLVAGSLILLPLALGISSHPAFVIPWLLRLTVLVRANLPQSALTNCCLLETKVRKPGARPGA